ncbi:MAG: hypothetical protein ACTSYA_09345 [Candidatus Kariarchaeaceae archaeon]
MKRNEISDSLKDISNKTGSITFNVKYTDTEGNRKIHDLFIAFAKEEANNNYLSALQLLLKYKDIFNWMDRLNLRLDDLEFKTERLKEIVLSSIKEGSEQKEESSEDKGPKFY